MVLTLRNRLKILAYIGAATVFVLSMIDDGPHLALSFKRLSVLETVLFLCIGLFDRAVWRWWKVPQWLRTGPVLRGTWKGIIRPTDGDSAAIVAYLSVRQTYSGVAFRLLTAEMTSESTTAVLTGQPDGLAIGEYVYQSTPKDSVRKRSPIHFGAARFECVGPRPDRIEGAYFTDRRTSGEMEFSERVDRVTHTFADASALAFGA
jgi:hypothetical protein